MEIDYCIERYGYIVLVPHPQEFLTGNELDPVKTELFRSLITRLRENYSFGTYETLRKDWRQLQQANNM
jgi:hypothetical protein